MVVGWSGMAGLPAMGENQTIAGAVVCGATEMLATGSLKEAVYELPNDPGKLPLTVAASPNDQCYINLRGQFHAPPDWK